MSPAAGSTQRLTVLYVVSLSAIAGLALIGQVWIQQALNRQSLDIQVISAAQQQQISSQRLVKSILALKLPATAEEQRERAQELEAAIQAAEASQQTLADIQTAAELPTSRRQQIQQMVTQLSPQYETLIETARDTLETNASDAPVSRLQQRRQPIRSLATLLAVNRAFVNNMDGLILEYNQRVAAETQRLKRLELSLLLITLAVLVLEGFVIFRPAVRKIQQMMTALDQSLQKTQKTARHLAIEQQKSEKLLLNILPQPIAQRLKQKSAAIADGFSNVTVLFADIVGFTQLSTTMPPQKLVSLLNGIFSAFDQLCEKHDLEKIKTIGDAYMVVGGLPVAREDHAKAVVDFALDMQRAIATFNQDTGESFRIRIGINSGPVVAGVIGTKKFIYDLWGDTVNIASRMESHGTPGSIQITESTFQQVKDHFQIEALGKIAVKGKGEMITYRVIKSL
ncbi:MAG: adenylate/guanylate cyclase domain-containing protein [Cyanobacteria bacterium J06648_16]